ncbi:amidohydrolase family protein [Aeropyrum camini]|uniref:Predicted metal-dependent hydrolase n=1 Tax=Aeropyrum camini SY1 = JCM 12091 TaxID=1198449 RepID=U3TI59_9CREN|nr:amidohydrolase family protein [Aeropyrum camini]BAN91044.1 predicted metal-dependent hydrolase [Aeropyrum camini SY1 = JCM 12091]
MKGADVEFIDFHVHMPYWIRDPAKSCRRLLLEELTAGAVGAIVIGVDASLEAVKRRVTPREIVDAAMEDFDLLAFQQVGYIGRMVMEPEKFLEDFLGDFHKHRRGPEDLKACKTVDPKFFHIIVSYSPGREEEIAEIVRSDPTILGVKVFPTFHFTRPDSPRLNKVYRAVEEAGGLVVVHTGCDPGPWELTRFCSEARPSYVANAAKRFENLTFVIAHLGAYSALKPGIFFEETLKALHLENVYADTSAADPFFAAMAAKEGFADKILFGSDYPYVSGYNVATAAKEILSLEIDESDKEAILRLNAEKLLNSLPRGRELAAD